MSCWWLIVAKLFVGGRSGSGGGVYARVQNTPPCPTSSCCLSRGVFLL